MKRPHFTLVAVAACFLAGTPSAFSETALERLDRAQKELQSQSAAKGKEKSDDENASDPDVSADRRERFAVQNLLQELRRVREILASGNESSAMQMLSQMQSSTTASAKTKNTLDAVVEQIRTEQTEKEAALIREIDAACQRAGQAVLKAKEPKDLDATLEELARVSESKVTNRYNEFGNNHASAKLQAAVTFVNRWQDYLLARSRNNEENVSSILRNLADNSNNQPPLIPRSEILALQPQTTDSENSASARSRRPRRSQAQVDADALEIVQKVKKFDDVADALTKLAALRTEFMSQSSYFGSESELGTALIALQGLQRTYTEFQNGLATSLSLNSGRSEMTTHPVIEGALLPVRIELIKMVVPRYLGAADDAKAVQGEALDPYLRRLIESAKKRQDWDAVVRGLELKRTLAATSANPYFISNDQEVTAFKNFFAGRNLEQAGQYEQAVISYLTALRSGQEDLPANLIGELLAGIQKAHAADYTAGVAYVLNPPATPYGDIPRYGPAGTSRSVYDRLRGLPGFPGTPPAEEKLAVPAASPSPVPALPKTPPTVSSDTNP